MTHAKQFIIVIYLITHSLSIGWAAKPYVPIHPDPVLEPWRWRSFPELKGQDVRCIAEDTNGHMWFGTKNSILMYDGITWVSFGTDDGLDGQPIVALSVSDKGTLYAATVRGIFTYQSTAWYRVFPKQDTISWYINDMIVAPDDHIWVGSVWGLVHLHKTATTLYTLQAIKQDFETQLPNFKYVTLPSDTMFTQKATYQGLGIQRIENTISWVISGSPADSAGIKIGDRITETKDLPQKNGTSRTQLTLAGQAPRTLILDKHAGQGDIKEFEIQDIHITQNDHVWITLSTGHVARLQHPTNQWHIFPNPNTLEMNRPLRVTDMPNGHIWVISEDRTQGIRTFDGQNWSAHKLSEVGGTNVNPSILRTKNGTIWVGGHEGYLHALRKGKWHIYQTPHLPLPTTRIVDLLEAKDGALWIIGQGSAPIRLDYGSQRWTTFENLNYACQSPNGHQWFLSQNNAVIQFDGKSWTRYDTSDGLIDTPTGVFATQKGDIWVVGSDKGTAASSHRIQNTWHAQTYPDLSWGIDARATHEARDGTIWLGAAVDWFADRGHKGGILSISPTNLEHHTPPDVLRYIYGIGQTADASIWIGSYRGIHTYKQNTWSRIDTLESLQSRIDVVYTPPDGELWLGHRNQGVFKYDGQTWQQFDSNDGLTDNATRSILKTQDGTTWIVSAQGISRFDGTTWTASALPSELYTDLRGSLQQSTDGTLWINTASDTWHRRGRDPTNPSQQHALRVVHYVPDTQPPKTTITLAAKEVSQPGNTTITWQGIDPWHQTPIADLLYAWQLDNGTWSPFTPETHRVFQALKSGDHTFRVKARDRDFNTDPIPATITFTVIPPVWQQPWFLIVATLSLALITVQTVRVIRRDKYLQRTNQALSDANNNLFAVNTQLKATNQHLEDTRQQLIIQEKMASLGNLVAGVAHEMNTPLGALNSSVDVIRRCVNRISQIVSDRQTETSQDANYQKAMHLLETNAQTTHTVSERISQIVNSLKNFARLDEAEFQRIDIHEGLESILLLRQKDLKDKIEIIKTYGEIPPVACYPSELNQVFMNILSNAIEALEDTGEIHIQTSIDGSSICITFTDTGCGIPPENQGQIFNPGFTTKGVGVGVGLGLAISYRIIEKHNGIILIESEMGKGTTCRIEIPIETDMGDKP